MSKTDRYDYKWEGQFMYADGSWLYHGKDNWSVTQNINGTEKTLKGNNLIEFAKKLPMENLNKSLINAGLMLKDNDKNESKEHEFHAWLTSNNSQLLAKRATAICLQHFSEVMLSNKAKFKKTKSKQKDTNKPYNIVASIVGQNLTVQIKNLPKGWPCWFFLHSDKDIISEELPFYILALPHLFFEINNNLKIKKMKLKKLLIF